MDEPPHAGGHGGSHEVLEAAYVRPLVFGRRAPRPGAGRAVMTQSTPARADAIAERSPTSAGEDVSAGRCRADAASSVG